MSVKMELVRNLSPELFATAIVLLVTYWAVNRLLSNRKLPPGPWGWPLLGCYFSLKATHEDYARLRERYGDVFSFRGLGGQLFVVLNGSKVIKEVLLNRADEFDGRPMGSNLVSWLSDGLGIAQEEGDPWQEHRRFYSQTVRRFGVGKQEMEDKIRDEVQLMLRDLRQQEQEKPAKLDFHVAYVTHSVISDLLFGQKMDKQGDFGRFLQVMHRFVVAFLGRLHILTGLPFDLGMIFHPKLRVLNKEKNGIRKFTDDIVRDQVATFDPSYHRGYVDVYLNQRKEHQEKGLLDQSTFTMERLNAISMNMFFEGTESTSAAISNLLLGLAKHPEVQKKVQEELDSIVGQERLPSFEDRKQLPYVDATMQELFRMTALFPLTTQYSNFKETTIMGYRIPKRSIIISDLASIHFDPNEFPNPQKFEPRRFLDNEGKRIKKEGPYPFGIGKRSCVGEAMAIVEVFLILTSILQSFTLLPLEGERDVKLVPRD